MLSIGDLGFSEMRLKLLDLSCNQLSSDNFLWSVVEIDYLNLTYNAYKKLNVSLLDNTRTDLWGEWQHLFTRIRRLHDNDAYRKSLQLRVVDERSHRVEKR